MAVRPLYGLEVKALASELGSSLLGGRLRKVFRTEGGEYLFSFHRGGRVDLLVSLPGMAFLTTRAWPVPQVPPGDAAALRKLLSNAPLRAVEQEGFQRVLTLSLGNRRLVLELFHEGNVLVLSPEGRIEFALRQREFRHRRVFVGEAYVPPPPGPLDGGFSPGDLGAALEGARDAVRGLARAGLGGLYAEEALTRAGVPKEARPEELRDGDLEEISSAIASLVEEASKPRGYLYLEGDKVVNYSFARLQVLSGLEVREFETFSGALEEAYVSEPSPPKEALQLRERIERHEAQLEELRASLEEARAVADEMAVRAQELEALRKRVWGMLTSGVPPKEIAERLEGVVSVDPARRRVTVSLGTGNATIRLDAGVWDSIQEQYARVKRLERRIRGLEQVIEELRSRPPVVEKRVRRPRTRFWFESYRWFFSTEDFLVLGGRDAQSNERLVKKHLSEGDIYVHAQIHGAPSVVIKCSGRRPGEETLRQAGKFAVSYSRAWAAGWGSASAYWVEAWQVSKKAPSGEFLPRGAFMVYGRRNYLRDLELELAIGPIEHRGVRILMAGPPEAVEARAERYVLLAPGGSPKDRVAKEVAQALGWDPQEVLPLLPPGRSQILKK